MDATRHQREGQNRFKRHLLAGWQKMWESLGARSWERTRHCTCHKWLFQGAHCTGAWRSGRGGDWGTDSAGIGQEAGFVQEEDKKKTGGQKDGQGTGTALRLQRVRAWRRRAGL